MAGKASYTPGPWIPRYLEADDLIIRKPGWGIYTPNFDVVANIFRGAPIRNEADARLIAKAPEMAEALREVLSYFATRTGPTWHDQSIAESRCPICKAERILREVEGL